MKTFGEPLRQAREAKGIDIDSVAQITRIARRYLHALEGGRLEALPGGAFAKGYIKTYAEFLEIDAKPLLAAYSGEARRRGLGTPERDREMLEEMKKLLDRRGARKRHRGSWGFVALVLGLIGGAAVWLLRPRATPAIEPLPAPEPPVTVQAVPPEPEPEPPEPTPHLRVTESGIGTEIRERNLAGRGERFVAGTKLWYWTRIVGGESGERIRHVWIHQGRTTMLATLSLGGSHWRTYSALTLPPGSEGPWTVEARTDDGQILSRDEFVCLSTPDGN
jgi:transcriptional regulator with XRE-family HTH domain